MTVLEILRLKASLPIKWKIVKDPKGVVRARTQRPQAAGGIYGALTL
ncbi:MAG: hypothetical protein R2788_02835 [Saprospiraceae bacterium]